MHPYVIGQAIGLAFIGTMLVMGWKRVPFTPWIAISGMVMLLIALLLTQRPLHWAIIVAFYFAWYAVARAARWGYERLTN